jgi:hypothetical protein
VLSVFERQDEVRFPVRHRHRTARVQARRAHLAAGIIVLAESNHASVSIQRIGRAAMLLLALRFLGTQTGAEVNGFQVGIDLLRLRD